MNCGEQFLSNNNNNNNKGTRKTREISGPSSRVKKTLCNIMIGALGKNF